MSKTKTLCALYTRVSSKGQMENDYGSLETQREKLEAYCRSQEGFEIYLVYEDGGISGKNAERPAFQEMLRDIMAGKVNCILTYKIDRISRSVKDFHNLISFLDKYNVKFISVTQSFDSNSAIGRLIRNILADFAQFESEMIADRTSDKMLQRAEKGTWNGGNPPYGYTKNDKRLVIHPKEAKRVKFLFDFFADKPSLASLRDTLNSRRWFTRSGNRWGKTSLDHILRNPIYTGKVRYKEEIYDGQHQGLINDPLFQKVQNLRRDFSHVTTKMERCFLLKGLLKCSCSAPH